MSETLSLRSCPALPLPHADRSIRDLDLHGALESLAGGQRLAVLFEARRVLRPGGVLRIASSCAELRALCRRLGLQPMQEPRDARGQETAGQLAFSKADRRAAGSPLVSLLMPAYKPQFFENSLASAIAQTYGNLEIIVCDDSAGTEIEAITQRPGHRRPLRYVRNPVRLGGRGNLAKCFGLASGEFVKFLNDDDLLAPHCVERLVEAFRGAPEVTLATSYRPRVDEAGERLPDDPATRPLVERDTVIEGVTLANCMIVGGVNVIGEPSTTLFRRADLQEAMPEDFRFQNPDCFGIVDMAMWTALLLKGDAVYLREELTRFRQHAGQQQRDPEVVAASTRNARLLRERWLALGLSARCAPDTLMTRPFPPSDEPWQARRLAPAAPPPPRQLWHYSTQYESRQAGGRRPRPFLGRDSGEGAP